MAGITEQVEVQEEVPLIKLFKMLPTSEFGEIED